MPDPCVRLNVSSLCFGNGTVEKAHQRRSRCSNTSTYFSVRFGVLAVCGLAGWSFLNSSVKDPKPFTPTRGPSDARQGWSHGAAAELAEPALSLIEGLTLVVYSASSVSKKGTDLFFNQLFRPHLDFSSNEGRETDYQVM